MRVASRTDKENYEDNKEKYKERHKIYYENNKEKHKEQHKIYYENNKDKYINNRKEQISCECGCLISKHHIERHRKTLKHIKLLEEQQI